MQIHVSPEMNRLLNAAAELSLRRRHFYVGVEHLFEGDAQGLFVAEQGLFLSRRIPMQSGFSAAGVVQGLHQAGADSPNGGGATEEIGECFAFRTQVGGERQAGVDRGLGLQHPRLGPGELLFRLADVGAAGEQIGGQTGRDGGGQGQLVERLAARHRVIHQAARRAAEQQGQRVILLAPLPFEGSPSRLRQEPSIKIYKEYRSYGENDCI